MQQLDWALKFEFTCSDLLQQREAPDVHKQDRLWLLSLAQLVRGGSHCSASKGVTYQDKLGSIDAGIVIENLFSSFLTLDHLDDR